MSLRRRTYLWLALVVGAAALVWMLNRPIRFPRAAGEAAAPPSVAVDAENPGAPRLEGAPVDAEPGPAIEPPIAPRIEPASDVSAASDAWRLEVEVTGPRGERVTSGLLRFYADEGELVALVALSDADRQTLDVRGAGRLVVFPHLAGAPHVTDMLLPPASGVRTIRVELDLGLEIAGRVRDPYGKPVTATVRARPVEVPPWGRTKSLFVWRGRQVADGGFRIPGLWPGRYRLEVRLPMRKAGRASPGRLPALPEVEAGDTDVVIDLLPEAGLLLRFADADSGESVSVFADIHRVEGGVETWVRHMTGAYAQFDEVPGTQTTLRIRAEGYEPYDIDSHEFRAGELADVVVVPLRRDPEGLVPVVLHVRDDTGEAIESLSVTRWIRIGSGGDLRTGIGQSAEAIGGRLDLPLPPGEHRIELRPPYDPKTESPSLLLAKTLELNLERGEPYEETVRLDRGGIVRIFHPISLTFGSFVRDPKDQELVRTTPRWPEPGTREHYPVPAGDWELVFVLDGQKHAVPVRVEKGAATKVVLDPDEFLTK